MSRNRTNSLVFAILVAIVGGLSSSAQSAILATLTDRCSSSVWISPDYYAGIVNPPGAIFLNRLEAAPYTAWSGIMTVRRFGPDKYVRWYCGMTAERSRCPAATRQVQGRLGPNRLLQIRCHA